MPDNAPDNAIDSILDQIIRREGGFSDDPIDRGGATKFGITIRTLRAWRGGRVSVDDVRRLTRGEARAIYRSQYVDKPRFNRIRDKRLLEQVVDYGVNSGPKTATKDLQQAAGTAADGIIGPNTLRAVNRAEARALGNKLAVARAKRLGRIVKRDPSQLRFLNGWLNRALSFVA